MFWQTGISLYIAETAFSELMFGDQRCTMVSVTN
jgi:hypothetical protein